jgi:hypothetical protein
MPPRSRAWFAALILFGQACPSPCPDGGWAALADSESGFTRIEAGHVFRVERGSQGGMHVWTGADFGDVAPGSADVIDGLRRDDLPYVEFFLDGPNGQLSPSNLQRPVLLRGDAAFRLPRRQLVFRHYERLPDDWETLDWAQIEAEMELEEHRVSVRLEDTCGQVVETSLPVWLTFPPREQGVAPNPVGDPLSELL